MVYICTTISHRHRELTYGYRREGLEGEVVGIWNVHAHTAIFKIGN